MPGASPHLRRPPAAEAVAPAPRRPGAARGLKPAAGGAGCAPRAQLAVDAFAGGLGANPIEAGLNRLGFWTLTFVALSLLPTPHHDLLGWRWPQRLRRMLGLFAFAYATLHLCWYAGVDKLFDLHEIATDVTKRRFQAVGVGAWLCLLPLALTSTDGSVRRLGYRRWKRLHRLAYVAAGLGVVHFVWRVKADLRRPLVFAAVIGVLLAARVAAAARAGLSSRRARSARPS
jgi:sulfoxide reductase heme-binding subunit YedZ